MADTMEGVVVEGEQPKTENVEQKTVAGKSLITTLEDAYRFLSLFILHHVMAASPHMSYFHDA